MTVARTIGYAALRMLSVPWLSVSRRWNGLRILAYHEVPSNEVFRMQLAHLVRHYSPIASVAEIDTATRPPVWVTFDDGHPSIVDVGIDVLDEFGVKATAFICPGLIGTDEPFWWQVVENALGAETPVNGSPIPRDEVARLKRLPDQQRRERVEEIHQSIEAHTGSRFHTRQLTVQEVQKWLNGGHSLGNHTWDHPILSNCSASEQRRQVEHAHAWLLAHHMPTQLFAYPNGDWAPACEEALDDTGYDIGLLFDHRIALNPPDLTTSRIRVNATDPINEFAAKVSGLHPAISQRLRR